MKRKIRDAMATGLMACVVGWVFASPAGAITVITVPGAEADITFGVGTITVTLKDLNADPGDVSQVLTGFSMALANLPAAESLTASSGVERTVAKDKTYTDGASVAAGWADLSSGKILKLDVLSGPGHAGPAHAIIGAPAADNKYDSAGGSIAGNPSHNPFLAQSATFTFNVSGFGPLSATSATFQFGTTDGAGQITTQVSATPLPSAAMSGFALLGLMAGLRWLRRRSQSGEP
jgi:hypothetical protein